MPSSRLTRPSSASSSDLLIIAVTYRSTAHALAFVRQIYEQNLDGLDLKLMIVSNDTPTEWAQLRNRLPDRVVGHWTGTNIGYFPAAKHAFARHKEAELSYPRWTVVCNVDLVFPQKTFFQELVRTRGCDVLAPRIIDDSHPESDLNPYLRDRPSLFGALLRCLMQGSPFLSTVWIAAHRIRKAGRPRSAAVPETIYAPHGSFVAFGASFFARVGGIPPAPLFAEEEALGEICLSHGLRIDYRPSLELRHFGHPSTGRLRPAELRAMKRAALNEVIRRRVLPKLSRP